ncbi:rhodanese-like domain-containing protein [Flavimarina sp. Hel_I_48]|uniref:rhodanese-like domain-containing protein n=1 Tax=Flavimarina sp. Hel_I_48 TaxID=1392488 RepID=UPI0004DFB93C|nr:rhodanese-like domain-containing protein [Flavimarina sp. Hel_I_48]
MKNITQEEWAKGIAEDENVEILDVRTDEEVEAGMIPNARQIDIHKGQGFIDEVEKIDKSKNVYVYCRSGARSGQACQIMDSLGFESTYNLEGGFMKWEGETTQPED